MLERLFENFIRLNLNLPAELIEVFKIKENNESLSQVNEKNIINSNFSNKKISIVPYSFTMDKFITAIKKSYLYESLDNSKFIDLGVVYYSEGKVSQLDNKQYQVMFRLVTHEDENEYLEVMFNDISDVVHVEREKAINNCRYVYLSKIAH
jgi:hypothetical protein